MLKVSLRTEIFTWENALDYSKGYQSQRIFLVADPFILESGMIEHVEARLPATNDSSGTRSLIKEIEKLRNKIEMPVDFKSYAIDYTTSRKEEIAEAALLDSCTTTNPVQPDKADIIRILAELR